MELDGYTNLENPKGKVQTAALWPTEHVSNREREQQYRLIYSLNLWQVVTTVLIALGRPMSEKSSVSLVLHQELTLLIVSRTGQYRP